MTPVVTDAMLRAQRLALETQIDQTGQLMHSLLAQKQARIEKLASILNTICANREAFAEDGPEIENAPEGLLVKDFAKLAEWADNVNEAAWMRAQEVGQ